jgi:hypothetical protein
MADAEPVTQRDDALRAVRGDRSPGGRDGRRQQITGVTMRTMGFRRGRAHSVLRAGLAVVAFAAAMSPAGAAQAQGGGTAKPAPGAVAPFPVPSLPDPPFTVAPELIHGFDVTGFIQDATVSPDDSACKGTPAERLGGTVTVNGGQITVPCNTVIQMPANTFRWAEFVHGGPTPGIKDAFPVDVHSVAPYPLFELHAIGNTVDGDAIAGLLFASQQSVNAASGVIDRIDYSTGRLLVDSGDPAHPSVVEINDPSGRFGREQSPDKRFSVDDANPTVHAGTGYPMCVPRTDPASADDPLCPQQNRPAPPCRTFADAGVSPPASGDLAQAAAGQSFCSQFVMPAPPAAGGKTTGPDAREQAPFEPGDFITYSGTLVHDPAGDYISAHTVEANVGIYTQPGIQPSYLAIGEFGVGTADPSATAAGGVAQETQDRIFLEAETTDVQTPVDIYLMDVDPETGAVRNRWVTPYEMTGENQFGSPTGGITTQATGPQPQRARLRATKAPVGLLNQPTRMLRVVARSLCKPSMTAGQPALDACLRGAPEEANGLIAGQYAAPVFEFIFPENVRPGDPIVPNDLWHLPFLRNGEGAGTPSGVGPLEPTPWGGKPDPVATPAPAPAPAPAGGGAAAGGAAPAPGAAGAGAGAVVPAGAGAAAGAPAPGGAGAAAAPGTVGVAAIPGLAPAGAAAPPATGAAPAAGTAAAALVPRIAGLVAPATVPAAVARRAGLVVRFTAPAAGGTAVVRVLRKRQGALRLIGSQVVTVRRGANRVALGAKALRARLTPGRFVVQVVPRARNGRAGRALAATLRVIP